MARLVAESGSLTGREWKIDPGLTLGREAHNSIPMPDNRRSSRDHAKVWRESPGKYSIADLGSTNGTLVNDEKVTRHPLVDGDEVRVGEVTFRFLLDDDEKPKKREAGPARAAAVLGGAPGAGGGGGAGAASGAGAVPTIEVKQRVLQYHKKTERGSVLRWDLSQMSGPMKWGIVLAGIAIAVALFLVVKGLVGGAAEPPP